MPKPNIEALVAQFSASYNAQAKDTLWVNQSEQFRAFWNSRILGNDTEPISEEDCDKIIKILDRNGKGNTKASEAVAKAMIPQGAWRRMLNEFHANETLGKIVTNILKEENSAKKAQRIDDLYDFNKDQRNHLTGPSGNAVNALLAAYDPLKNSCVISLKDRYSILEFLGEPVSDEIKSSSPGVQITKTSSLLETASKRQGIIGSARTLTVFFYSPEVQPLWKNSLTIKAPDKHITVTVPPDIDHEEGDMGLATDVDVRESMKVQALVAQIGATMGFTIWLPKSDRGRVLKAWNAMDGELCTELPLGYEPVTLKTIEQIDVIWLKKRAIVRAFEVEHTTAVYSGLC